MSAVIDFPLNEQTRTDINRVFALQQQTKLAWRRDTVDQRLARLQRLRDVFSDHRQQMLDAAHADMNKPMAEAVLGELFPVLNTIDFARKHLKGWMKPRRVRTPMSMLGTRSELVHEPKGVSLIIAPWNYPFFLSFVPLANALAAGCPTIIKPSEMTPAMTGVIRDIVAAAFTPDFCGRRSHNRWTPPYRGRRPDTDGAALLLLMMIIAPSRTAYRTGSAPADRALRVALAGGDQDSSQNAGAR